MSEFMLDAASAELSPEWYRRYRKLFLKNKDLNKELATAASANDRLLQELCVRTERLDKAEKLASRLISTGNKKLLN